MMFRVRGAWRAMRPHQWVKNGFVLVGLLFGRQWADTTLLVPGLWLLLGFCLASSAVYVYNDLNDAEADRLHPMKRLRPIASGILPKSWVASLAVTLAILGLSFAACASWVAAACVLAYVLLNVAYSLRLKHVVIIDVFCISAGFMLRILAGTLGLDIAPSSWLLLCGLMFTLFLGFAKRRAELVHALSDGSARKVLGEYSPAALEQFLSISASCSVLSYALYTVSPETVAQHGTHHLIYTVPLIVYGMFRYVHLLHQQGRGQDTARDLFADRHLLLTLLLWVALTLAILS